VKLTSKNKWGLTFVLLPGPATSLAWGNVHKHLPQKTMIQAQAGEKKAQTALALNRVLDTGNHKSIIRYNGPLCSKRIWNCTKPKPSSHLRFRTPLRFNT
jgi:hypothetical protein